MFSKINSFSTRGIDGYRITVEVDVSNGLPSFVMVGYLAEEVREAQERVRTALRNAGFCLPPKRITVNLSPAGVRKEGTGCDLAIAAGILRCLWEQGEKAKIRKTDEPARKWMGWKMRRTILHRIGTNGRLSVNWVWTAASSR
ncbi:magnesium chelatase domain-containing protein [Clostridium sp. AF22-10]|uniref:magnesium chelatase domain-containing protein n=1 Tax=Clostridium sp. AF22-10 TaxID=2293004 RepID=UPI0015FD5EB2